MAEFVAVGTERLPEDLPIVALPELGALGTTTPAEAAASTNTSPHAPLPAPPFAMEPACARSRMLVRRDGSLRLAPCPLVDDDPFLDAPPDLELACQAAISPVHPRCSVCRFPGVDYVGKAFSGV